MTITKQDINAVLARLTEAFPQSFVLEQYQPHRPLKVGIFSEIAARCPDLARSDLVTVLNISRSGVRIGTSARRKYGNRSKKPQPGQPAATHRS